MCGCEHHWDTNAPCTCSCPDHEGVRREMEQRADAEGASGLRAAVEALADEWDRLADGNEAARGKPTKVAAYYRRHAHQLRAILAAHPPEPEASEVVEWGVRANTQADGSEHTGFGMPRREAEASADRLRHIWKSGGVSQHWSDTIRLVRRTRTTYADRVTEWEEVDE